ncbi:MAG: serine/threonine-protein kinase [Polyangiaceae bacterium]
MALEHRLSELGKYHLIAELARGGMGDVYLAIQQGPAGWSKLVVVKELRLRESPRALGMFLDEARLAARLNHPNIVQTNEIGEASGRHFLAMEYLEGQSLRAVLQQCAKERPLPLPMHLRILIDALAGLHHAHELTDFEGSPLEVVHRDVSPHNVFVTYEGQTKVLDFGIAKATDSTQHTADGVIRGKVAYMAPEQVRGEKVDRRADIFSMGIMLWEAASGRRFWDGMNDLAIINRLGGGDIPVDRDDLPEFPLELGPVCRKALAPKASDRYETAHELQMELETILMRKGKVATQRGIGTVVSELFVVERKKTKRAIETAIRRVRSASSPNLRRDLLQLDDPASLDEFAGASSSSRLRAADASGSNPGSSSGSNPESRRFTPTPSDDAVTASFQHRLGYGEKREPLGMSEPKILPSTWDAKEPSYSASVSASVSPLVAAGGVDRVTPSELLPLPTRKARKITGSVLAVSVLVTLGIFGGTKLVDVALRNAATAPRESTSSEAVRIPATVPSVDVSLRATPEGARVFVDDVEVTNPWKDTRPKDGRRHTIRIEASDFDSRVETMPFDKDLALFVALERSPTHGAESATAKEGKTDDAAAKTAPTRPKVEPRRPKFKTSIDTDNPYGQ